MDSSPSALLRLLVPKAPKLFKTALWHTLSLSPTSSKWDLRTEMTVTILRDMLGPNSAPSSITKQQKMTCTDPGVKGKMWISRVDFPVLEDAGEGEVLDVRQALFRAIRELQMPGEDSKWTEPENVSVYGEWTGYRAGATDKEGEPEGMSEAEKYEKLMEETKNKTTVLYFHGGAMYLLDPTSYRMNTAKIARVNGGRVFSARYRLAPQHTFPAALLDVLTIYLSLLHPPPGSPHTAVPANEIVFGGDSAGGLLCTSLLQLLLQFQRTSTKLRFHGQTIDTPPLPAGLALVSPWLDVSRSLPSIEGLNKYDYLPTPSQTRDHPPPPCEAWPTDPPRAELYCETSALSHPLVSPLTAKDWTGAPPVLFSVGEEQLYDENCVVAQRMAAQGVRVVWRCFEAMPHVFAYLIDRGKGSDLHFEEYAQFCKAVVEGPAEVESGGVFIRAKTFEREDVDLGRLTELSEEDVKRCMDEAKERIEAKGTLASKEARPML